MLKLQLGLHAALKTRGHECQENKGKGSKREGLRRSCFGNPKCLGLEHAHPKPVGAVRGVGEDRGSQGLEDRGQCPARLGPNSYAP